MHSVHSDSATWAIYTFVMSSRQGCCMSTRLAFALSFYVFGRKQKYNIRNTTSIWLFLARVQMVELDPSFVKWCVSTIGHTQRRLDGFSESTMARYGSWRMADRSRSTLVVISDGAHVICNCDMRTLLITI